jgi:hypothetical protein
MYFVSNGPCDQPKYHTNARKEQKHGDIHIGKLQCSHPEHPSSTDRTKPVVPIHRQAGSKKPFFDGSVQRTRCRVVRYLAFLCVPCRVCFALCVRQPGVLL